MAKKTGWMLVDGNAGAEGWHEVTWESGAARVRFDKTGTGKITDVWVTEPTPQNLRRIPLARIETTVAAGSDHAPHARYRLHRPAKRKLGPEFYANVATAYRDAVARGNPNPRKQLAADTGAADATVAAWIMEARKRGHLPPGQPGKVTAHHLSDEGVKGQ
jgi:hypothetical protein